MNDGIALLRGRRPRVRIATLALAGASLALVGAGCGGSSSSSSSGSSGSSGSTGSSTSASSGSGSCSGKDLSIGLFAPMTGSNGEYGQTGLKATKLAIADFHKAHPDCKVSIVQYDAQGDPAPAPGLARKAVQDQSVVAINGPGFSGVVQAAEPILEAAGMPTVTANATNATLAHQGWKVFHRTIVNDGQEGPAAAEFLVKDKHYTRLAMVDNKQTYGKGLADEAAAESKKLGATIVDSEEIDTTASDYSSTVNKIEAAKPQAVFCGCLDPEAARLLKQLRAAGSKVAFSGGSGLHTPNFIKEAGANIAEGSMTATGGADATTTAKGRAWLARWKKAYGGEPAIYGVEYYNAAVAILNAIGAGNTTRESINAYLGTEHFQGPTGPVSFGPDGNIKSAKVNVYAVKNGDFKFVTSIKTLPD